LEIIRPRLTIVKWYDSAGLDKEGWSYREDVEQLEPLYLYSMGWLFKESKEFVVIVPHWGEDQKTNFDGAIAIPKKVIIDRIDFEVTPKGTVKKVTK
jgi:hypothetical protein